MMTAHDYLIHSLAAISTSITVFSLVLSAPCVGSGSNVSLIHLLISALYI